jgi:hypothetical protein
VINRDRVTTERADAPMLCRRLMVTMNSCTRGPQAIHGFGDRKGVGFKNSVTPCDSGDLQRDRVYERYAVTLLEQRVEHFHGHELRDADLLVYEQGLCRDGHHLAADGVVRLLQRLQAEIDLAAGSN